MCPCGNGECRSSKKQSITGFLKLDWQLMILLKTDLVLFRFYCKLLPILTEKISQLSSKIT
ncbi:unknown protein [Microcystis aeruginosa NIES-843]|uniref:Uncharacterized protein n=1 Tax=Microcystis aeruginosa (strain NIES-843 / IAM M-2473) TaxID=449447 RepID=B0JTZ8_MICAN|nr:unknown protein [Microcystis aeruginosa NIES-843]